MPDIDFIIKIVSDLLRKGESMAHIHDVLVNVGLSEDDIFLIIKASKILLEARVAKDKELSKDTIFKVRRI